MNLDFLSNIKGKIMDYFQPVQNAVGGAADAINNLVNHQNQPPKLISPVPPSSGVKNMYPMGSPEYPPPNNVPYLNQQPFVQQQPVQQQPTQQQSIQQMPQATSIPQVTLEQLMTGLGKFAQQAGVSQVPIATQSADYLRGGLGEGLPDPLLPWLLLLKETRGGLDLLKPERANRGVNNPANIIPPEGIASYPSLEVGVMGGGPNNQKGLKGVLDNPVYDEYKKSGDLVDFLKHYTPYTEGGANPSYDEQLATLSALRSLFQ